jgi:TolA-binding protein
MSSFVYVFSRFTPEALLIEALLITTLCAGYTAYWVLHKRKSGVIDQEVPAPVIKNYLNQLIIDAQELRSQLFGLLAAVGGMDPKMIAAGNVDVKMTSLEAKILEQTRAMEALLTDKVRIERELANAKAQAGAAPTAIASASMAGGDPAVVASLQTKVTDLEGKLAEYSIIEDDLANLKRLQQENQQLRSALAAKGGDVSATLASSPKDTPAATAASVAPVAATTAPVAAATGDPQFEGLVDQVEKSIQETPTVATATPTTPDLVAAPTAVESQSAEKTDADLVAEFEKMLNG